MHMIMIVFADVELLVVLTCHYFFSQHDVKKTTMIFLSIIRLVVLHLLLWLCGFI